MKLKISFKHLKHTPALDERIQEKSKHFEKYCDASCTVQWVCWVEDGQHWAEAKVHGPKFDFFAKASSDNLYKCLDLVVEKMERQFEKKKDMWKNKIHNHAYASPKYQEIQQMIKDEDEVHAELYDDKTA